MRITNNMMIGNLNYNLNKSLNRMDMLQYQTSTGKRFKVPSDDPIGASKSLKLRTDMSKVAQYRRNVSDAKSWMTESESAINELNTITKRAYELTIQAANGINTGDDLEKIKAEISELKDNIIQLANTAYGGRTIFTGHDTDKNLLDKDGNYIVDLKESYARDEEGYILGKNGKPIEINGTKIKTDSKMQELIDRGLAEKKDLSIISEVVEYNTGETETVGVNTLGNKIFGKAEYKKNSNGDYLDKDGNIINQSDPDFDSKKVLLADYTSEITGGDKSYIVALFEKLEKNLEEENSQGLQENITELQGYESNLLSVVAEIGARTNRLNLTEEKLENQALNLEELLSDVEDVSLPEAYMRFMLEKNVYNASLSVGSQIIQPSLVDFIR